MCLDCSRNQNFCKHCHGARRWCVNRQAIALIQWVIRLEAPDDREFPPSNIRYNSHTWNPCAWR